MIPTLGIDPGVRGGLAVLQSDGEPALIIPFRPFWLHKELVNAVTLGYNMLYSYPHHPGLAYVETVGYIRGDGGKGAFTFGQIAGLIRGTLLSLGVVVHGVTPMTWQVRMGCLSGGDKNVTKRRAQELFPRVKVTHNIADALLIARYGWECLRL